MPSTSVPNRTSGLSAPAKEILGYLDRNRRASDSLVGIARWWLLRQRIETMTNQVQQALNELVRLGLVLQTNKLNAPSTYRLNRRRLKTIRRLLNSAPHA